MAIYVEKKYQKSSLPAIVEDSLESGSHENAPSINAVKKAIANPNLLINSDFRNLVNQRGKTTYGTDYNTHYTIDRWAASVNTEVVVNNGSITVTNKKGDADMYFAYKFEKVLPLDKYTASCKVLDITGDVWIKQHHFKLTKGINFYTFDDTFESFAFGLAAGASVTLEWCKLEKGDTATPFNPRLFDEELALCKRFYQKIPTEYLGLIMSMGSQTYRILSNYQGFRTNPTVKWINGTQLAFFNRTDKGYSFNITITEFTYNKEGMLIIKGTNDTGGTIEPGIVGIALLSHAAVELDAEIY